MENISERDVTSEIVRQARPAWGTEHPMHSRPIQITVDKHDPNPIGGQGCGQAARHPCLALTRQGSSHQNYCRAITAVKREQFQLNIANRLPKSGVLPLRNRRWSSSEGRSLEPRHQTEAFNSEGFFDLLLASEACQQAIQ